MTKQEKLDILTQLFIDAHYTDLDNVAPKGDPKPFVLRSPMTKQEDDCIDFVYSLIEDE